MTNPEPSVFLTAILATLASFLDSGWMLTACLILLALLGLGVCVMWGMRGARRDLDELKRYFDRGQR